nr:unnamed protein product [Callosobruchus chinensis]
MQETIFLLKAPLEGFATTVQEKKLESEQKLCAQLVIFHYVRTALLVFTHSSLGSFCITKLL